MKYINCKLCALFIAILSFASCENFFTSDSNRLMYDDAYAQMAKNDSVYSLLGILTKLQEVADRYVLLGEMRGDLLMPNDFTSADLRDVANFSATADNKYNNIDDYYKIINACNCYLAYIDSSRYIREYTAAKVIRAWTYLQIETIYGKATYYTQPILTIEDNDRDYPLLRMDEICPYLIADLEPLVDYACPNLGTVFTLESSYFFIPVRVLLGDLYLWNGDYHKAAETYYDYLVLGKKPLNKAYRTSYNNSLFTSYTDGWSVSWSTVLPDETISFIPMAVDPGDGKVSDLNAKFTGDLGAPYQIAASDSYIQTNLEQSHYLSDYELYTQGDLRLRAAVNSKWSREMMLDTLNILKHQTTFSTANVINLYRLPQVYLRFAEACNQAGYPSLAFTLLKHGLSYNNILKYVAPSELNSGARFLDFSDEVFDNNAAVHARGSGHSAENNRYDLSVGDSIWTYDAEADSMIYVLASVEHKAAVKDTLDRLILQEMALETAFEGSRFADLIRFSQRRKAASFLADKVAARSNEFDEELYLLLLDERNWYLPTD